MTKVRGVTGGGAGTNKLVSTRNFKTEPQTYKIDPGRASMIGTSVYGFSKGPIQTAGGAYSNPVGPSQCECKPGGGRTILPSGSQSHHSADRPMPAGRSLFK
jgi:hypothetical protein